MTDYGVLYLFAGQKRLREMKAEPSDNGENICEVFNSTNRNSSETQEQQMMANQMYSAGK